MFLRHDFDYVLRLFEKNDEAYVEEEDVTNQNKNSKDSKKQAKDLSKTLKYVKVKKHHESVPFKILKKIYNYDPTFRFTSRYWNTIMVAVVALYYVFIYWTYTVSMFATEWIALIPESIPNRIEIKPGELLCNNLPDLCLEQLQSFGAFNISLGQSKIISFIPSLRSSLYAVVITPLFVSGLICLVQIFFLIRETKENLILLYQGRCEFVKKASSLPKDSIASSSFHFGGYFIKLKKKYIKIS